MGSFTINVDMGKLCPSCKKPGAVKFNNGNWGICLSCIDKLIKEELNKAKDKNHAKKEKIKR